MVEWSLISQLLVKLASLAGRTGQITLATEVQMSRQRYPVPAELWNLTIINWLNFRISQFD